MRVLHINRNYLTSPLHQVMMDHLDSSEADSTVFAPTDDKSLSLIEPNPNVIVSECFSKLDRFFYGRKQRKIRAALELCTDVSKFDMIHAYTLFTDGNCALKLSAKYHIPYIVAVRNTDVNDFFKKFPWLRRRGVEIMRNASKVMFLSPAYRDQVFERYVPKNLKAELVQKTEIIPNGIDDFWLNSPKTESLQEHMYRLEQKELRVIYAGRIDRNKNISSTIQALEQLSADGWNVEFTVVGNVADEKEFRRISQTPFARYIPAQPKERLCELYRQNDIFVMPSFTETFGLVYAEAMSQGIPVIYSKGQGFDGQFPEGTVGYHATACDSADIAQAMRNALDRYAEISRGCPAAAEKFCWNTIAERYLEIYGDILRNDGRNG